MAVVGGNGRVVERAFGWADLEQHIPMTPATLQCCASVSKVITTVAVLRAWEMGAACLDTPIDVYLDRVIRHPMHPEAPITLRMLLSHAAGLADNMSVLRSLYVDGDSSLALGEFMDGYLRPGGAWYDPDANFASAAPGQVFRYCSVGLALAAHVVEKACATPFDALCRKEIFEPLSMTSTAWHLRDLDPDRLATPYRARRSGSVHPIAQYGYPDYPDGQLRSTAGDLARFVAMCMEGGAFDGVRILRRETIECMLQPPFPLLCADQGLGWQRWSRSGATVWGHDGIDWGASARACFEPQARVAFVALANAAWPVDDTGRPGSLDELQAMIQAEFLGFERPDADAESQARQGGGPL